MKHIQVLARSANSGLSDILQRIIDILTALIPAINVIKGEAT